VSKKQKNLTLNLETPKFPRKKMPPGQRVFVDRKKQANKDFCRGKNDG